MAGYPGIPGYRPAAKRPGTFGIGGAAGGGRGAAPTKPKPKTKTDPATGMPTMMTPQEIRAEANAQTWKSIQAMQSALPSQAGIAAQYGAQRSAITPLIDAHRDWLLKAGEYQVNQTNALSQMVQGVTGSADAAQVGAAGLAGAPLGAGAPTTNVSPTQAAMPVAAYGTSFANYLHSLAPYADSLGGMALGRVNEAERQDMTSLRDARSKVALQQPDIYSKNYATLSNTALNTYKGELAAIAAGDKNTLAGAKLGETNRHNTTLESLASDRNAISSRRADAAIALANSKIAGSGGKTPAEVKSLKSSLAKAYDIYGKVGGTKTPTRFAVRLTYNPPKLPSGQPGAPKDTKVFAGGTVEEVRGLMRAFLKSHNTTSKNSAIPNGRWSQDGAIAAPPNTPKVVTGKTGEANRRLKAWRYLVQQNPDMDREALKRLFRLGVGAPPGGK